MNIMSLATYRSLLPEFIGFQSISTDPAHQSDLKRTADWLTDLFEAKGFEAVQWRDKDRNPIVRASFNADHPETVLIYGHYDVQPANQAGWNSPPFELTERN